MTSRIETKKGPMNEDLEDALMVGFQPPNQTGMVPKATRSGEPREIERVQARDIRDI